MKYEFSFKCELIQYLFELKRNWWVCVYVLNKLRRFEGLFRWHFLQFGFGRSKSSFCIYHWIKFSRLTCLTEEQGMIPRNRTQYDIFIISEHTYMGKTKTSIYILLKSIHNKLGRKMKAQHDPWFTFHTNNSLISIVHSQSQQNRFQGHPRWLRSFQI